METDFRTLLTGDAGIAALVGSRVYWNAIPQNAGNPCIAIYRIGGAPAVTMGGPDSLVKASVQLDIRAITYASALAVRDAVMPVVSGYAGTLGTTIFSGLFLQSERHDSAKPGTVLYHRVSLDFSVWSKPTP